MITQLKSLVLNQILAFLRLLTELMHEWLINDANSLMDERNDLGENYGMIICSSKFVFPVLPL